MLAIEINEAKESNIKTLDDYKKSKPGSLDEIVTWFRDYKMWEGKAQNKFLWDGEI